MAWGIVHGHLVYCMHVAQQCSRTVLAPVVSVGVDLFAHDLHVFSRGAAVELVAAGLFATQLVRMLGVILDDDPKVRRRLLGLLKKTTNIHRE